MYQITSLTSDAYQTMNLALSDGTIIYIAITFIENQNAWVLQTLNYQSFSLNNITLTCSPNMLNSWRNIIPFGLACFSQQNRDPQLIDDFSSSNCKLYIMTSDEVAYYTSLLTAGAPNG